MAKEKYLWKGNKHAKDRKDTKVLAAVDLTEEVFDRCGHVACMINLKSLKSIILISCDQPRKETRTWKTLFSPPLKSSMLQFSNRDHRGGKEKHHEPDEAPGYSI